MLCVEKTPRLTEPPIPVLALRLRNAAKSLEVSERTLWTWTQRGDVPHIRRGGVVLYPVDGLRRWLESQLRATTAGRSTV